MTGMRKYTEQLLSNVIHLTALSTGAFAASLLMLVFPGMTQYGLPLILGLMLLSWLAYRRWLKHEPDEELPAWFGGFAKGAAAGVAAYFAIELARLLLEPLVDLTAYDKIIGTVRFACPGLFGAIGALKHREDKIEEDHNNG